MKEKIYLIPGLMTDHRLWDKITPHLDEYELIHTPIPHSDDFDEIVNFLDSSIECEKVNLLGFSLGGYIASYFAIKYPSRVQRLFLVGSTPSETEEKDIDYRTKKLEEARVNAFKPLGFEKAKALLENEDDHHIANTMMDMFNDLGHQSFISQLSSTLNRVDLHEPLMKVKVPTKFFYSSDDRLLNHKSIESIKNKENNFQWVCREGTSHNIPLEVPLHLSAEIKAWMT